MKKIDISVNVCTYNRAEMLRGALKSLICQDTEGEFSYEIIVIDNASTDNTKAVVEQVSKISPVPIRYILEEEKGVAQARNRGVKESQGTWIAFFDDDQLAESDWLKNLLYIALQMGADCVGGVVLLDLPKEQLSRLGHVCRRNLGEHNYYEKPTKCQGKVIPSTGNILIFKKIFNSIDIFDTSMFAGGEDSDLIFRARAAGFDIWIAPNAIVHHVIPSYRLEYDYFRLVSLRCGIQYAYIDCKLFGCGKMLLLCIARIGQALLVNFPFLLLAYLKRDKTEILDRKCLLLRAVGYTRQCLLSVAPKILPQRHFFEAMDFRKKRENVIKGIFHEKT